jgi:hypothetical protein
MKQTAVEWLMPKILELTLQLSLRKISARNCELEIANLFEQAKAMEKKNTIAFGYRCIGEVDSELGDLIYKKVPEEIYNETFKSE